MEKLNVESLKVSDLSLNELDGRHLVKSYAIKGSQNSPD